MHRINRYFTNYHLRKDKLSLMLITVEARWWAYAIHWTTVFIVSTFLDVSDFNVKLRNERNQMHKVQVNTGGQRQGWWRGGAPIWGLFMDLSAQWRPGLDVTVTFHLAAGNSWHWCPEDQKTTLHPKPPVLTSPPQLQVTGESLLYKVPPHTLTRFNWPWILL